MHITILALGSRGDIQPFAALGSGLIRAGYQVRFITFESYASLIVEHGLDFHPIRGNPQALVASAGPNMLNLVRSFSSLAEGYARDLSAPILGETDLLINQLPGGLYGFDLAEKFGFPMVAAAVIPMARTTAFPFMAFPKLTLPGYNKMTYVLGEQLVWFMYRGVINHWRKQTLNLPSLPIRGYFHQLGTEQIPILNGFSPSVVPRPEDWNEHIHITGYWFPEVQNWQPPADLKAFINAGPPPVFIGFGSMPVNNPDQKTQVILKALDQSGTRGILHAGWGGLGNQSLPDNVYKIEYAPYSWLFPRMAMVIHHGGSGTTGDGLRAGVPTCAVPFLFDQHFWGERIAALGVGPNPIRHRDLGVERLKQTIQLGTANAQMRNRAADLGKKIRAEEGVKNALEVIEKILKDKQER